MHIWCWKCDKMIWMNDIEEYIEHWDVHYRSEDDEVMAELR